MASFTGGALVNKNSPRSLNLIRNPLTEMPAPEVDARRMPWNIAGRFGKGKSATLTVNQTIAGKTAVQRFDTGKTSTLPGITVEPVSGVGDDAYYVSYSKTTRAGLGLVVKKGNSAFEVRVYGFDIDKAKPVAKTLAQSVAGKL